MENITDFEDLLIKKCGDKVTLRRDKYGADSLAFRQRIIQKKVKIIP